MIKTVLQDQFINIAIGALFAISSSRELRKGEGLMGNPSFLRALKFNLFVFLPIGIYLAVVFTDWSWMYIMDYRDHSVVWTIVGIIGYTICHILGFTVAGGFIKRGNIMGAYATFGAGLLGLLIVSFSLLNQLIHVGTYEQYANGTAPTALANTSFLLSLVVIGIYFFVPLGLMLKKNFSIK